VSIARMLFQTAHVASVTGKNSYGKPTYGAPRAIKVRHEGQVNLTKSSRGDDVVSRHRVYTLEQILSSDLVWLPGADSTKVEEGNQVVSLSFVPDAAGSRILYAVDL